LVMQMKALLLAVFVVSLVAAKPIINHVYMHHDHRPNARLLSATRWGGIDIDAKSPVVAVGGDVWPVSIYWSYITVGSQKFPVAIDSGSFTLDIPLEGCKGCITKPPNNAYKPTDAPLKCSDPSCPSFCSGTCSFSNTYETCDPTNPTEPCTISGDWYKDKVSIGGTDPVEVVFGAISYQTSNFYQFFTVDGVMGMAGGITDTSVFATMAKEGVVPEYVWGMCINNAGTKSNGTLVLGGIEESLHTSDSKLVYTPNSNGNYYEMETLGINVDNLPVDDVPQNVIIDTGTNDLLLPTETYSSMKNQFLSLCNSVNLVGICNVDSSKTLFDGVCYSMTPQDVQQFPNITLVVRNVNLTMTGTDYVLQGFGTIPYQPNGKYCLGISPTGTGGLFIIGDTLLQNYYSVYDRVNKQIGWAPVNRQACGSVGF